VKRTCKISWTPLKDQPTNHVKKEEEKVQVTGTHSIFYKIIAEKFSNPDKDRII
jgi:hypothetical protein